MTPLLLGVGIAIGIVVGRFVLPAVTRRAREQRFANQFVKAGFTWEENANVQGWLTRDPNNDDWVLWDEYHGHMLRSGDTDRHWRKSPESLAQCLELGRQYDQQVQRTLWSDNE
jgi:hypothetical protein